MNVILTACVLAVATAPASDWPGFRGSGDGVAADKQLPTKWSDAENLAWVADLPGYGQSAPVVWGGAVYLTAVEGPDREKGYVVALDAKTGRERWRHIFEPTQKAKWGYTVSRAAPTPLADADGVYCFFEGGNLIAFTHEGKLRWDRSLVTDYGKLEGGHGLGSSPCQTADTIYVLVDHPGPSYLLAVEKATGKTRWKADRTKRMSWSSPVVATRNGKPELVVSSNGSVAGYDPASGKQLWELAGISGNTLPSASATGERVLVGAGAARGGAESKGATKSNCCLTLTDDGGKPGYKVAWSAGAATASYATPISYGGCAYFVNATGVLYCLDLKTGKEFYAERLPGPCWASPVAAGGLVYFFCKDGQAVVVKAGPEYDVVAINRLWDHAKVKKPESKGETAPKGTSQEYMDPIVYGVAAADGSIFVRSGSQVYRIGK